MNKTHTTAMMFIHENNLLRLSAANIIIFVDFALSLFIVCCCWMLQNINKRCTPPSQRTPSISRLQIINPYIPSRQNTDTPCLQIRYVRVRIFRDTPVLVSPPVHAARFSAPVSGCPLPARCRQSCRRYSRCRYCLRSVLCSVRRFWRRHARRVCCRHDRLHSGSLFR